MEYLSHIYTLLTKQSDSVICWNKKPNKEALDNVKGRIAEMTYVLNKSLYPASRVSDLV